MNRRWIRRQEHLKDWRNSIWRPDGDKSAKDSYLKWHMDFFENFYESPPLEQSRLLDVGCGYMLKNFEEVQMLEQLLERLGAEYTGVDPIDEWFALGKPYPVRLYKAAGEALPFDNERFDCILCLGVLDHVVRPKQVLDEIFRVLKPGGTMWFASSYAKGSVVGILKEKIRHRLGLDQNHRFIWTPAELERLLLGAKFGIIRTRDCPCTTSYFIEGRKGG